MAPSQLFNACRSIYNQLSSCCLIDKPHIRHRKVNNWAFFHLRSSVESLGPQPPFILSFTNIYCELPPGTTDELHTWKKRRALVKQWVSGHSGASLAVHHAPPSSLPKRFRPTAPSVNYLCMNEPGRISSKIFLINGAVTPHVNASPNRLDITQSPTPACLSIVSVLRYLFAKTNVKSLCTKMFPKHQRSRLPFIVFYFSPGIILYLFKGRKPTGKGVFLEGDTWEEQRTQISTKTPCSLRLRKIPWLYHPLYPSTSW